MCMHTHCHQTMVIKPAQQPAFGLFCSKRDSVLVSNPTHWYNVFQITYHSETFYRIPHNTTYSQLVTTYVQAYVATKL